MNRTEVFLLGGQSNMEGSGMVAALGAPFHEPVPGVQIWHPENGWVVLTPGYDGKDTFGPEIGFGHEMARIMPGTDIRLIKYAASGTALHDDWSPVVKGAQYRRFMETANAALKDLRHSDTDFEIAAMLWFQGESDALEGQGDVYERNLIDFIAHMRQQFEMPNMPFVIARVLSYYGRKNGHAQIVREAQVRVAASDPYSAWFDTDDSPIIDPVNNPAHYNAEGNLINGRRFAAACKSLLS